MKEKAYEIAFNKGVIPKALVSREGNFIVVNDAFSKLLEYTELELQRKKFQEITDPSDVFIDEQESERVANGKIEGYEMLKSYITKSKHLIQVRLRVDAVRDDKGKFICFVSQVVPITENIPTIPTIDIKVAKMLTWLEKNAKLILWILTGIAGIGYFLKDIINKL
jgi:PAS domain S-box-containing protein